MLGTLGWPPRQGAAPSEEPSTRIRVRCGSDPSADFQAQYAGQPGGQREPGAAVSRLKSVTAIFRARQSGSTPQGTHPDRVARGGVKSPDARVEGFPAELAAGVNRGAPGDIRWEGHPSERLGVEGWAPSNVRPGKSRVALLRPQSGGPEVSAGVASSTIPGAAAPQPGRPRGLRWCCQLDDSQRRRPSDGVVQDHRSCAWVRPASECLRLGSRPAAGEGASVAAVPRTGVLRRRWRVRPGRTGRVGAGSGLPHAECR